MESREQSRLFFVSLPRILYKHNRYIMENLGIGLQLMAVGMSTVFVILLVVIWGGKLLIKVVNKIAPEESVAPKKVAATVATIDANTKAILDQVVAQITGGKGHVSSAKKI